MLVDAARLLYLLHVLYDKEMMSRVRRSAGMTKGLCKHENRLPLAQKMPSRSYQTILAALVISPRSRRRSDPEPEQRSTKHVHKTSHLHNLHCHKCLPGL